MPSRDYNSWRLEKLSDPKRAATYLKAALESSTEDFFYALKNVIQAHQVSEVAKKAGVKRESLYRVGNPTWDTLKAVMQAVGVKFSDIEPIDARDLAPPRSAGTRKRRGRRKTSGTNYQQLALPLAYNPPIATASGASVAPMAQHEEGAVEVLSIITEVAVLPGFFLEQQRGAGSLLYTPS